MIKRMMLAFLLWIEDLISRWAERREIERTRDEQERNDDRDRGDAGDISDRLRHGTNGKRDAGGSVSDTDDAGSTDPRG